MFLISVPNIFAMIGVTPAYYEVDFKPNTKQVFAFNFLSDPDIKLEVYVEGDLEKYVKLNKKEIIGGGGVTATLELPSEIEIPGTHLILIGARQVSEEEEGIAVVGNMRGVIRLKVPYPGKYATAEISTNNANAGEPVNIQITINNLGKEDIDAYTMLDIYNEYGKVETVDFGRKPIATAGSARFKKKLDTENYKPGDYNASVFVSYGGNRPATATKIFRLGELYVSITNHSNYFLREKINKFDIEAESFWNDPIENLYANVTILNYSVSFLTPSVRIEPWSKVRLEGFFDTTPIKKDNFIARIILNYEGRTTEKIVKLEFKKEINYLTYGIIAGVIAIILIIAIVVIFIIIRRKKKETFRAKTRGI